MTITSHFGAEGTPKETTTDTDSRSASLPPRCSSRGCSPRRRSHPSPGRKAPSQHSITRGTLDLPLGWYVSLTGERGVRLRSALGPEHAFMQAKIASDTCRAEPGTRGGNEGDRPGALRIS